MGDKPEDLSGFSLEHCDLKTLFGRLVIAEKARFDLTHGLCDLLESGEGGSVQFEAMTDLRNVQILHRFACDSIMDAIGGRLRELSES